MNSNLFELTGVTEDEMKIWCRENNMQFYKNSTKRKFFKMIQNGQIIRNKDGKLITKEE